MEMELKDVLPLLYERFGAFQTLWNLYITIALGVLGFVATAEKASKSKIIRVILIIVFLVFALINLETLVRIREQRSILAELALELADKQNPLEVRLAEASGASGTINFLRSFHLVLDLFVVSLVWFIPVLRTKHKDNDY